MLIELVNFIPFYINQSFVKDLNKKKHVKKNYKSLR